MEGEDALDKIENSKCWAPPSPLDRSVWREKKQIRDFPGESGDKVSTQNGKRISSHELMAVLCLGGLSCNVGKLFSISRLQSQQSSSPWTAKRPLL